MNILITFLLTEWAGAPLAIWFLGVMAALFMFVIGMSKRIRLRTTQGQLDFEMKPPARKKSERLSPEAPPRPE
jgi:uncharacterized integral membrane protein